MNDKDPIRPANRAADADSRRSPDDPRKMAAADASDTTAAPESGADDAVERHRIRYNPT